MSPGPVLLSEALRLALMLPGPDDRLDVLLRRVEAAMQAPRGRQPDRDAPPREPSP